MTERKKEWFKGIRKEIEQLAKFHSIEVPTVYGDGEETTDKMVSLEELGRILSEIEDAINETESEDKLDGDPIDIDKAVEHYEGTMGVLKGIDLEVDDE